MLKYKIKILKVLIILFQPKLTGFPTAQSVWSVVLEVG